MRAMAAPSLLLLLLVFLALFAVTHTFLLPTSLTHSRHLLDRQSALYLKRPPKDRARNHVNKRIKIGVRTTSAEAKRKFRGFPKKRKENPFADDLTMQLQAITEHANSTGKPLPLPSNLTITQDLLPVVEEFRFIESLDSGLGKYYLRGKLSSDMLHSVFEDVKKELKNPNIKHTFPGSFPKGEYPPGVYHTWKKKAVIQFMCRCAAAAATSNGLLICDENRRVYRLEESVAPLCYEDPLSVVVLETEAHTVTNGDTLPFEFLFLAAYTGMDHEELQSAQQASDAAAAAAAEQAKNALGDTESAAMDLSVDEDGAASDTEFDHDLLNMFLDDPTLNQAEDDDNDDNDE